MCKESSTDKLRLRSNSGGDPPSSEFSPFIRVLYPNGFDGIFIHVNEKIDFN